MPLTGPPAVDFYSQLSGLGDTLQANAKLAQQNQLAQNTKDAFAKFSALDPSAPDYGKQVVGIAQNLGAGGNTDAAMKFLTVASQEAERQRQIKNDAISQGNQSAYLKIAQSNASRAQSNADREWNYDPTDERTDQAKAHGLDPNTPEGRNFILTGSLPEPKKPITFETLGGSKFLVPDSTAPSGYKVVDPNTVGNPAAAAAPTASGVVPPQAQSGPQATTGGPPAAPTANGTPTPTQPVDLTQVDPKTGRREEWLKAQSPDVQAYIKKIADYEIDPRTTSIKGGHREQVMSAVAQYDPTYDQNSFGSRAKAIKDFATGTQGNAIRSFDVATDHLDTLQKYADALKNGDVRAINAIRQQWQTQTGSPLPTNVQAVAPIVGAEVSKAIIGSNNALADREELRKPLNGAGSPEQLSGAIQGYKALMAGQLRGLKKQYEDTTGKKDFLTRLRDNTKTILSDGDGGSGQPNKTSLGISWSVQ